MPIIKHEIDPLADTVITLHNPGAPFALWKESLDGLADDEDLSDVEEDTKSAVPSVNEMMTKHSILEYEYEMKESTIRSSDGGSEATAAPIADNGVPASSAVLDSESTVEGEMGNEVQYFVSSRHLMLVSPWFRRRFTSDTFSESKPSALDGRYHYSASDWDEEALLILLNIIHLRTRKVPASISLEMFAKIAVIADYYELEDEQALDRNVKDWTANIWANSYFPKIYCRDLVLWICISRIFCLREQFEQATAVAIKASWGWIQDLGLPIHEGITSEIDRARCQAIEQVIAKLHQLAERYSDIGYSCPKFKHHSPQCGACLYGTLMKYMKRWGYLTPRPEAPFVGMRFYNVCNKIRRIQNPQWWHTSRQAHHHYSSSEAFMLHPCKLGSEIDTIVQDAQAEIKGLKLKDIHVNHSQ
ncbi:hypothetical protein BU24DRAFT_449394, partial [Aaosphaeria arxii CBS 175.79]